MSLYSASTLWFFPDYFTDMLPLVRDVYSIGLPLGLMLVKPAVLLFVLTSMATLLLMRGREVTPILLLLLTASVAFLVVYLLQRKGWPYHSYPMLAFAWLGFGYAIGTLGSAGPGNRSSRLRIGTAAASAAALFVPTLVWFNHAIDAGFLQAAIARLGLQHPTILVVSGNGRVAHPLTRAMGGVWASRQQSLLVASYLDYARDSGSADPQTLAVLESYGARERSWMIEDFKRSQPAVVVVDNMTGAWGKWLHESPESESLLKDYRLAETVRDIDIYVKPPRGPD